MKDYLHIKINDWTTGDIDGFEVLHGSYQPDYDSNRDIFVKAEKNITVGQNEKFFFLPGVTIPRIKLKDLYAQTKSKTVREVTEATKIIVGRKSNDNFTDHYWKYWIKTETLKTLLTSIKDNPKNSLDINTYNNCMDILDTYTEDIVLGNYDLSRLCDAAQAAGVIEYENYCHSSRSFYQIKSDYIELYKAVQVITVYDETSLISLVNGDDSTKIDEAMYESLKEMFTSTDNDNHVLAMEIMANSNYHESLMYLCFLFKEYSNIISNQKSRNHVNFKSLANYMGFHSPTYCGMSIDKVMDVMMRENALTKENAIRILAEFKDEISTSGETNYLKVSKITFGEEVMSYLLEKEKAKHEPEHIE